MGTTESRGVTLAEVLVVIVIIAVVAGLMMPAFTSAKHAAHKPICASNMHQLYLAMKLYESDYGEYPPDIPTYAAFRSYYPTVLWCPESKNRDNPGLRATDYTMLGTLMGAAFLSGTQLTNAERAFQDCRTLRGSAIPVVLDCNHIAPAVVATDTSSVYYLVRDDGSFASLLVFQADHTNPVCDVSYLPLYYSF
ncbi:MAG TPA: prepilin-type N-terminal cleavage/methylation domain-containing protein [Fimbriimonadaceae bacterium]|nr:prepilin-type N-terminal cleavage/methylation domain-containing protein [Fimbriimonadaceae bacterium]